MENKNKLFGYVSSLSEFNNLKVSADIDNKTYTIGGGSVQQCAEGEVPDVRWHIVVFIEDVTRIWTHGKFYASANAKLSDDYASPVYVEVKDLETGEVLFNPAKPGETIEEAILQLDTNVANLLTEILKNEEVVSTALNEHNLASGFNTNGKYIQQTTAKYISGAISLADADNLLDSAISSIAANVEALSGDLSGLFIPTKTSDLTNDSGYITIEDVENKNYITSAAIPTKVSAFENDAQYITSAAIPTKVSEFENDAKYQTESDVKAAIDGLINGAPGTLDTLGEIAEILSENTDGIGALVEELAKKANTTDVNAALDNKADKSTVTALSGTVDDVKDALDSITGSTNNVYTANGSAQYISDATSLKDADNKLDAAIAGVASELSNLSTEVSKIEIPTKVSAFENDAKYAYQGDIPTKVSQLENDSKYLTSYYVPTKVSEFNNDANYATKSEIPTKLGQLTNDANYAKSSEIPTNISQLTNDSNYATVSQVPTSTSQLTNDSGFITIDQVPEVSVPQNLSAFTNDVGYITLAQVPEVSKDLSQYDNSTSKFVSESELTGKNYITMGDVEGKNYITMSDVEGKNYITMSDVESKDYATKSELPTVPTNVSAFNNDAQYITSAAIPTNVSTFTNDAQYMTSSEVDAKVASLVDSAPETLNTLNELAAALGDDPNFATTITTEIGKKANDKLSQDSVIYPNVIYDGAELFTNTYANVSLEQAILNVDKNTKTLVEEVIKNEEVISTALNVHNISAGFTENGKYEQQTGANYINTATSLSEADLLLDEALKDVADIVSVLSGNVDGIDIPKNVTDLADHANYVTKTELDALSYVTSSALEELNYADLTYVTSELEKKANNTIAQDSKVYPEVKNLETQEILFTNIVAGDTLEAAILKTDANTATLVEEVLKNEEVISTAINELNASSGFGEDAKYIQKTNANYISGAISLADADNLLDSAIKAVADSVDQKIGNIDFSTYVTKQQLVDAAYITAKNAVSRQQLVDASYVTSTTLAEFNYADKAYVSSYVGQEIAKLVDTAPQTLDTLNELAAALNDDPNFATTVTTEIGKKADLTYVTTELEKKANATVAGEFDEYPVLKNTHTGEELFVNCHDGIAVSDAIHNIDKNTYTLVGEVLKNEEVISNAFNKINASAGFNENANYVVKENANVIGGATNLTEAVNILDTAVGELSNELDSINIALSDEYQSAVYPDDLTNVEFIAPVAGDDLDTAIGKLDTNVATLVDETLKIEETVSAALNRLNTSAGFNVNGIYEPAEDANFISEATTLTEAINLLDENLAIERDGAFFPIVRDITTEEEKYLFSYLYAGDSVVDAIYKTDSNVATLAYEVVRNEYVVSAFAYQINNSVGLNEYAEYKPKSSANYISDAKSLVDADNKLDAAIKSANNSIDSLNTAISNIHIPTTVAELNDSSDYYKKSELTRVSQLYNDSEYQRKPEVESIVSAYIANVVNSAPETLDTLKELADALGNDKDFATTVTNQIASKANNTISYDGATYPEVDDINSETEGITPIFVNTYSGTTLEQYVRNVDDNVARLVQECLDTEFVVSSALNQFNISAGFDENVKYVQNASAQYINSAASLADADNLLDSAISAVANSVSNMHIPKTVAELTDAGNYATTTYVTSELANKANNTISADSVVYPDNLVDFETSEPLFVNTAAGTTLEQAFINVDNNVKTLVEEVVKDEEVISTALNNINMAAGLDEHANYIVNDTANYIQGAISLAEADNLLDSAIKDVYSALDNYATKTEVSAKADNVLGNDYTGVEYQKIVNVNNTETEEVLFNPVVAGDTIANAIKKLDQNISTLVDETVKNELVVATAVNTLNESCGFGTDAKYVQHTDGYVIADAKSLQHADRLLDTAIGFYVGCSTTNTGAIPTTKHTCVMTLESDTSLTLDGSLDAGKEIILIIENTASSQINVSFNFGSNTDIQHYTNNGFGMNSSTSARVSIVSTGAKNYVSILWNDASE